MEVSKLRARSQTPPQPLLAEPWPLHCLVRNPELKASVSLPQSPIEKMKIMIEPTAGTEGGGDETLRVNHSEQCLPLRKDPTRG